MTNRSAGVCGECGHDDNDHVHYCAFDVEYGVCGCNAEYVRLTAEKRKCRRHEWMVEQQTGHTYCLYCDKQGPKGRTTTARPAVSRGRVHEHGIGGTQ